MPHVRLGNNSVIEAHKPDEGTDLVELHRREDLGRRVTSLSLNEVDGDGRPSRAMNLAMAARLWEQHSDEPPAWVESDDELLAALVADHFGGIPTERPDDWQEG